MKGFRIFLATFALTLTIGVVAQDSVIPSRLRVQSIGVGTVAPPVNGTITIGNTPRISMNGETPALQIGGSVTGSYFGLFQRYMNGVGGPDLGFYHSRGSTSGTHTILQNGDEIGSISFAASDGTPTQVKTARIIGKVDGNVSGPTDLPSRIEFYTTPDGSSVPALAASINNAKVFSSVGGFSGNGSGLTSLSAANLTGTLPAISGANLTSLNAANISSGTLPVARGGTGVTSSTGSGSVVLSTSPALTTPTVGGQQVCVANGTNCPAQNTNTMAAGIMSGIGTCSVSSGALRISSCSRVSAGVYNVNFSVNLGPNNPTCVATVNNNAGAVRSITVQTYNNIRKDVRIVDSAGTATDANFELICVAT